MVQAAQTNKAVKICSVQKRAELCQLLLESL